MSENGVTIPLPEIENFEDRIIEACARQMLTSRRVVADGDEVSYRSQLGQKIEKAMVEKIEEQAREFAPVIAAEILERGVSSVDQWGDATGHMRSLKSIVADAVLASMKQYGSRKDELGKMVKAEIQAQVEAQMKDAVAAASAPIMEAVRDEAQGFLRRALEKALATAQVAA